MALSCGRVYDLHSRQQLLRLARKSKHEEGEDTQGLGKRAAFPTSWGTPNLKHLSSPSAHWSHLRIMKEAHRFNLTLGICI